MKRIFPVIAVGFLMLVSLSACAQADENAASDVAYHCTPEGFTLVSTADGLHLTGRIDTPTPGYTVRYVPEVQGISLIPPMGSVIQVIDHVDIDLVLPHDVAAADGNVEIELEKSYAWGIPAITCTTAGTAPLIQKDTP